MSILPFTTVKKRRRTPWWVGVKRCAPVMVVIALWWGLAGLSRVSTVTPDDHAPVLLLAEPLLTESDWPGWRGGFRQGAISDGTLPVQWVLPHDPAPRDATETISPPVVAGNEIYLTRRRMGQTSGWLTCLDRHTGRLRWQSDYEEDPAFQKSRLLPTPACDGTRVFVAASWDGQLVLSAWNADGTRLWSRAVGPISRDVNPAQSPVVSGSYVIVAIDQKAPPWDWSGNGGYVAAVHRQTGEIVWRTPRDSGVGFATPVVAEIAGRRQVILPGRSRIQSYEVETGRGLWQARWSARTVAGAVAWDDQHVFATSGGIDRETVCIRADGTGDVTETHLVWRAKYAGSSGPPVLLEGSVIVAQEDGGVTALDRVNGRVVWQQLLAERFSTAPIRAGSRLYCLDDTGGVTVLDASQHGQVIAHSQSTGPHAVAVSGNQWLFVSSNGLTMITPEGPTRIAHEYPAGRSQR